MFKRDRHNSIHKLLLSLDSKVLAQSKSFFGGGTAAALLLDEYRESVDIDFLCSSVDGFRILRNCVSENSLGALLQGEVEQLREVRLHRDKISTFVKIDGFAVKVEFLLEGNIEISGYNDARLGVPVLSKEDMYATKLMANADRGLDRSTLSRDLIDLAMMINRWGPIPAGAIEKAKRSYGEYLVSAFEKTIVLIRDQNHLAGCIQKMQMDPALASTIRDTLAHCNPFGVDRSQQEADDSANDDEPPSPKG